MANPKIYCANDKMHKIRISFLIEEFEDVMENIRGKCMDIGCGPGDITKEILLPAIDSNAQIIGTDILESMIKYANETFSDEKRLQYEVLDIVIKNLPKKYISEFDHVFSFHTLQLCSDIRQAFENIYQMLRPNGTMLLSIVVSQDIFEVLKLLTQDTRFAQYMPDMIKNNMILPYQELKNARKEIKELLQSVGFKVHHCSLRDSCYSDGQPQQRQLLSKLF
ncbi:PREDICTED: uncharacterized protein LOC105448353 [Wasmannia auropunctata]|uniref:uncharacterized protein LOC105448353 n=1 Tax=Wasmannia auropunctata TaxID=64793 RepID=UPI0005F01476|nr:PREDICTED: uncharacterized protein LOC105448353 [Wasmannia auropunctata]